MGLFGNLISSFEPTFTIQQGIMTIVVAAVKADGEVDDEEYYRVKSMCARSPVFAHNSAEDDDALIKFADDMTHRLGVEQAIDKAGAALKMPQRETALAFAVDIVLADGIVSREEEAFIEMIVSKLGISGEVAQTVVSATIIRNRPA